MILVPHIPIEKRTARQELEAKYLAWRLSGGETTVIRKEHLRMKRGQWSGPIGKGPHGRFVIGEKQAPMDWAKVTG